MTLQGPRIKISQCRNQPHHVEQMAVLGNMTIADKVAVKALGQDAIAL